MATATFDPAPHLRPAGISLNRSGQESTAACFKEDEPPRTPEHLRKFRKSHRGQPGVRVRHWGDAEDEVDPKRTYGHRTGMKLEGNGVLDTRHDSRVQTFLLKKKEAIYESSKLEPLGKAFSRYELPENMRDISHGRASDKSEEARTLVQPVGNKALSGEEDPAVKKLYVKSHGTWEPGQQRVRDYNWKIDPNSHRFGIQDKEGYTEGVKKALNPSEEFDTGVKPTKLVAARAEEYKRQHGDHLGRPKNLGLGANLPPDHTFGRTTVHSADWDARMCTSGQYTIEEQLPDKDLGRTVLRGCAPESVIGPESGRVFGVPSIRDDIAEPARRSVADSQNYGTEPTAKELLYPAPFAARGVNENEFLSERSRDDIEDLMMSSGAISQQDTFSIVWAALEQDTGAPLDSSTVDTFRRKMMELSLSGQIDE